MKRLIIILVLLIAFFSVTKSIHAALPSELVGWWRFEDNVLDETTNDNDGYLMNGATYDSGKIDKALKLDGLNDYIDIPEKAGLNISNITVEMWLYPEMLNSDGTAKHVIDKRVAGTWAGEYTAYVRGNGDIDVAVLTETGSAFFNGVAGLIKMNEWSHLAFTWDGSILKIYLNGTKISKVDATDGNIVENNQSIKIGARADLGSPHFFKGLIDDVRIWNKALTEDDIKYTFDQESLDYCPETMNEVGDGIPNWDNFVEWGVNRWLWSSTNGWTQKINKKVPFYPGNQDTNGCSCGQILDLLRSSNVGNFEGHIKYGCSSSILDEFNKDLLDGEVDGMYFLETVTVPAITEIVYSSKVLELNKTYLLQARGTAWANESIEFDAEYSNTAGLDGATWVDGVTNYGSYGADLLDLKINDSFVDWGSFASDHKYSKEYVGTGLVISFEAWDFFPSNNSGNLYVDISQKLY